MALVSYQEIGDKISNTQIRKIIKFYSLAFRDRFRTVVNVLGDAIGAGIVAKFARDELRIMDEMQIKSQGDNHQDGTNKSWNTTQM